MQQLPGAEPVNGIMSADDAEDSGSDSASVNGIVQAPQRAGDARSAPTTVHDRARSTPAGPAAVVSAAAKDARRPSSPAARVPHSSKHGAPPPPGGSNAAKETFLNYFFGQNGPGPLAGASADRAAAIAGVVGNAGATTGVTPIGRDVSGSDPMLQAGLMAGKRTLEGNNAAFDMKSLGKHIEAVSACF